MVQHDYPHVFSPIRVKGIEFKNRIESSPMSPKLTDTTGSITTEFIEFFRSKARGGAAIVTIGNSAIDLAESQDETRHVDLGKDDVMLWLSKYADMCEDYGAYGSIEVNHSGRDAVYEFTGRTPYGPSACFTEGELARAKENGREPREVIAMDEDKIAQTVEKFAMAAYRCKKAGLKMILLHGGHGNLIAQFLSPYTNQRTDKYGGSLENRARFANDVLDAVRKKVGDDFIIEYRNSATEYVEGGLTYEESLEFCKMIESKIDILHLSAGMRAVASAVQYTMQPMYLPRMFNVHWAEKMKKEIRIPIATVGSILTLDNAEMILKNGWADFVAFGRSLLADPDLPRKSATGHKEDVYPCIRCNYHGRVVVGKTIGCAVNPFVGREMQFPRGIQKSEQKRKVFVVGGGPAGMQAAATARQRGHDVTLFEKENKLGGNLYYASASPIKEDLLDYYKFAVRQVEKSGAEIVLGHEVNSDFIEREKPDALILAVGARPIMPAIKGIENKKVAWAPLADTGEFDPGQNVIILGGGIVGFESAVAMAEDGRSALVIEQMSEPVGLARANSGTYHCLKNRADKAGVQLRTSIRLDEITDDVLYCFDLVNEKLLEIPYDSLLVAIGLRPRTEAVEAMRRSIFETEVYIVGDAKARPGTYAGQNIPTAVNTGFAAAAEL